MKLKKEEILGYRCDECNCLEKHKDMYDEKICYNCWEKNNLEKK